MHSVPLPSHVLAIVEASVSPGACPSFRHTLQLYQNSAEKTFIKASQKTLV